MEYSNIEREKVIAFLKQAIKLVESGDICEYKNMTDTLHMSFEVTRKTNNYVG